MAGGSLSLSRPQIVNIGVPELRFPAACFAVHIRAVFRIYTLKAAVTAETEQFEMSSLRLIVVLIVTVIAAACGGGSSSPSAPSTPTPPATQANRNPTITGMTVSPSFGIHGITQFNFASSATDPDGDNLTYSWEFADGQSRTGASTIHNYGNVYGTANVRLTVTDGRGGTITDTRPVTSAI